ncbi:MAG: YeiH family protein [Alphaproteobacteria bacterium]|jgi:uncharacterized integral membrane protein (TIGR00698 family)
MSESLERGFRDKAKLLFPGILAAVTIAIAARFLSEHYGGPTMLFALLIGMGFNFLSEEGPAVIGIEFASQRILQFGIALLGLGITFEQIMSFGVGVIGMVIAAVILTILIGLALSRLLGRGWRLGVLSGVAVAICGASAALAISSVLPKNANSERNTIFTVISVTALSTVAMIVYPMIVSVLELNAIDAGIFIGATIHDVAQVVGAGYSISEEAGDTATFIKLLRVSLLFPVVLIFSVIFSQGRSAKGKFVFPIPYFIIGFAVLVTLNSTLGVPEVIRQLLLELSRWCLVIAIAALGIKTHLKALITVGGKAFFLICSETVLLVVIVLAYLTYVR